MEVNLLIQEGIMAEYKPDEKGNMKYKGNDYQMVFGRIKEAHEKTWQHLLYEYCHSERHK